jgi:type IV secretion system protein VirD4
LLNPSEVMQLHGDYLIAFIKGVPPILARRLKYYADPVFRGSGIPPPLWWVLLVAVLALIWSQIN